MKIKVVFKGRVIREIERPIRVSGGVQYVTYKGKRVPLVRGKIHVDKALRPPKKLPAAGASVDNSEMTDRTSDEVRDGDISRYLVALAEPTNNVFEDQPYVEKVELTGEQQRIAYAPLASRLLVEAGPGTGKTETVAHRLASLLEQRLHPSAILVLSFSRNAVKTLATRIERLQVDAAGRVEELRHLSVRTFDSWTFRMLRQLNFQPGDLLRRSYDDNIHQLITQIKGENRSKVKALLEPVRHVIVDEFQDLSGVRGALVIELLETLAPPRKPGVGFTVLGDPAQAIYGFALESGLEEYAALTSGALVQQIGKRYDGNVKTLSLETNFRAKGQLASVMTNLRKLLIRRASGKAKFRSMVKITDRVTALDGDLSPEVLLREKIGSAAVLTSTNGEAIRVAQKLLEANEGSNDVPIRLHTRAQSMAVPAWLGATLGPLQDNSLTRTRFEKIYRHLYSGEGEPRAKALAVPPEPVAWQRLARAANVMPDSTVIDLRILRSRLEWTDLLPDDEGIQKSGIHVMTIHQSKGMEFDAVAVMTDSLESRALETDAQHVEAANMIFVGMTRAAKELFRVGEGQTYGPLKQSTFANHRCRWYSWRHGWMNIEAGIKGDVDPVGFVDRRVFGEEGALASGETVRACQQFLAVNAAALRGRKVMLCKWKIPGAANKYTYRIHLQQDDEAGPLLGVMSDHLTLDLLGMLWKKGYGLPSRMFNLRIEDVVTMGTERELPDSVAAPWATSRLWLGVNLYGTADFKTFKRN